MLINEHRNCEAIGSVELKASNGRLMHILYIIYYKWHRGRVSIEYGSFYAFSIEIYSMEPLIYSIKWLQNHVQFYKVMMKIYVIAVQQAL